MPSSSLNTDIYLCVGFGLGFLGLITQEIWWVFGGLLIFMSPFMGAGIDWELEKKKESEEFPID